MALRLFHTDSYDIVTVVGSHIANHIESEALIEIIRLVKSGESNDWKKKLNISLIFYVVKKK